MKNCVKDLLKNMVIIVVAICLLAGCAGESVKMETGARQTPTTTITGQAASSMDVESGKVTLTPGVVISISVTPESSEVDEENPLATVTPVLPTIIPTNTPVQEATVTPTSVTASPTQMVATPTLKPVTATPTIKINTPTPKAVTPTPTSTLEPELIVVYEMLDLVNEARAAEGLKPYTWSTKLEEICKERIDEILYNYQIGADLHDGCRTAGEDIAITAVAERAFELWMNSEAHRSIIMSDATEERYLDPTWEVWETVTCYNKDGVKYYAGDTIPGYPMAMACVGYGEIWVLVTEHRPGYF